MKIIDTHCDTITYIAQDGGSLYKNNLHISIEKMKKYEGYCQFFAVFSDPVYKSNALLHTLEIIDKLYCEINKYSEDIALCKSYDEYKNTDRICAFLSLEGADSVSGLDMLRNFYRLGVRMVSLTWNNTNHLASGVCDVSSEYGLTEIGRKVVEEMDSLGIILDVSHLSDKAFYEAAQVYKGPVIASHSNSRAVCPHRRNLTDEQFEVIKKSGGYAGINLYPLFLMERGSAGIDDIVRHIEHFMELGGEDNIGIGADFDGVDCLPDEIGGADDLEKLFERLAGCGYSDGVIEKIAYGNFERIMKNVLRS